MKNNTNSDTQKNQRLIRKLDLVALTEMRFSACGFKPNSEAVRLCLLSIQKDIQAFLGEKLMSISPDALYGFIKAGQELAKKGAEGQDPAPPQDAENALKPVADQSSLPTAKAGPSGKQDVQTK